MDLGDQIQEARDELVVRLQRIEGLLRNAPQGDSVPGSPVGLNIDTGPSDPQGEQQQRRGSTRLSNHLTASRLEDRFEERLRYHPRFSEVPIEEWTEAAAWWIKMVCPPSPFLCYVLFTVLGDCSSGRTRNFRVGNRPGRTIYQPVEGRLASS
jgi:hypothetical protein